MPELIDSHCHLDFDAFSHDRDAVIQRARDCNINHIIVPGVRRENWDDVRRLCERDAQLHACYGLHPYLAAEHSDEDIAELAGWLEHEECVAVGECGLDYRENQADRQLQLKFFDAQLAMAQAAGKPVVIHSVRATEDVIRSVTGRPGLYGMVHSYSGSYEQAMRLIRLGFYISLGGAMTFERATRLRATARRLPLGSILLETDAPDQPDADHAGERNEPAYLVKVLACLAELRDESIEEIAAQTTANARKLFGI